MSGQNVRRSLPFGGTFDGPVTSRRVPSWIVPQSDSGLRSARQTSKKPTEPPRESPEAVATARILAIEEAAALEVAQLREQLEHLEGRRAALAEELERQHEANKALIRALGKAREDLFLEGEGELLRLAMAVAERVVGAELKTPVPVITRWVKEAVALYGGGTGLTLVLSPALVAAMPAHEWEKVAGEVAVALDPNLEGICCELRGPDARATISARHRLDAVAEALGVQEAS